MSGPAFRRMSAEEYFPRRVWSPGQAGSSKAHANTILNVLFRSRPEAQRRGCRAFAAR
ncbi:hypothetical protein [Deinococcus hopiensis]|uniref:hypothetical protein n=1 Tax=Deinococcus hopiensis TaxID=309885 RepID=UPI001482A604|nr:hypothetical protein [Deinococcus hopiensis]